ncbi:MAG TPA: hypothetical protein PKD54_03145 [Pirellulaceae bacterium]|nr:hypothetical protein [Pirellulaceae bacterium]
MWWPRFAYVVVWLLFSLPYLAGHQRLAFRDVESIYGPYYLWLQVERAERGEPLWNPYDDFGYPVLADGKSLGWYWPSQWLGWDLFPYGMAFQWFWLFHVLLAAATAFELARRLGCVPWAATVAAVSYAFGGAVYFQLTNPIFLIGAAWLPVAILSCYFMSALRTWRGQLIAAVCTAAVTAIMILGGDPQMAYHVWLIAAVSMLAPLGSGLIKKLRRWVNWNPVKLRSQTCSPCTKRGRTYPWRQAAGRLIACMAMIGTTILLAAAQIFPSAEWTSRSDRAAFDQPRSIWEAVRTIGHRGEPLFSPWLGLFREPAMETHHDHIYWYSQPPWSVWELIWPNFSGRLDPHDRRWVDTLPGGSTMWTPTIYLGVSAIALALARLRWRGGARRDRWLTRIALFFGIGAGGYFGVGWALSAMGLNLGLGAPSLGPYWLLVVLAPEYALFRYPAKLFVVAALAFAVLAARQITGLFRRLGPQSVWVQQWRILGCLAGLTAIAMIVFGTLGFPQVWGAQQTELDTPLLDFEMWMAIGQSLVGVTALALVFLAFRKSLISPHAICILIAMVVAADVFVANRNCIPLESWRTASFNALSSEHRKAIVARLDSAVSNSAGRNLSHLLPHWAVLGSPGVASPTFASSDPVEFLAWHQQIGDAPQQRVAYFTTLPETKSVEFRRMPRAQVRREVLRLYEGQFVEVAEPTNNNHGERIVPAFDQVAIHQFEPNDIVIKCSHREAGWVVLFDLFDPGWHVEVVQVPGNPGRALPICRFQGIFRAVRVEAGDRWLHFTYRPQAMTIGRWISRLAWLALWVLAGWWMVRLWQRWRSEHF